MVKKEETFETALVKLESIIKELESGNIDLDKSIDKYKEAMDLVKFCNTKLESATKTINKVLQENGKEENFEIE